MNYHPAEKEVLALLLLLKTCYTQLAGRTIHVYTRFSTLEWVHTSKSLFGRTTQFAGSSTVRMDPQLLYADPTVGLWSRSADRPKPRNTVAMVVAHGLSGDCLTGQ
ncbi:hypothetical protein PHMEG_00041859 [Phytophthora megakarya]|uniref:Reverse transcriptase RNase H-like domain-containing protein n=1 Tax=Phytophthora megakarya TaxID=4795 RepID=A0A225UBZ6_9STRA|nr:hypothetical protein PHMEG_00041859 [Phytophthora megakarya]